MNHKLFKELHNIRGQYGVLCMKFLGAIDKDADGNITIGHQGYAKEALEMACEWFKCREGAGKEWQ